MTSNLVLYDSMYELAERLKDERAKWSITSCKDSAMKLHHRLDPQVKAELDAAQAESVRCRTELRKKLWEEEKKAAEVKKQEKAKKAEKAKAAAEKKREQAELERMRLWINQKWHEKDFGQGLAEPAKGEAPKFAKTAKVEIRNYVAALERLRIRCPDLPPELAAQWGTLVQEFPVMWLERHRRGPPLGNQAGRKFTELINELLQEWVSFLSILQVLVKCCGTKENKPYVCALEATCRTGPTPPTRSSPKQCFPLVCTYIWIFLVRTASLITT